MGILSFVNDEAEKASYDVKDSFGDEMSEGTVYDDDDVDKGNDERDNGEDGGTDYECTYDEEGSYHEEGSIQKGNVSPSPIGVMGEVATAVEKTEDQEALQELPRTVRQTTPKKSLVSVGSVEVVPPHNNQNGALYYRDKISNAAAEEAEKVTLASATNPFSILAPCEQQQWFELVDKARVLASNADADAALQRCPNSLTSDGEFDKRIRNLRSDALELCIEALELADDDASLHRLVVSLTSALGWLHAL